MSGIWNVNNIYNDSLKKLTNKLSFQVGEIILARVMNLDENSDEVLLRLLDGWQFPAKLNKPLDYQPLGLTRFKVEGFKDGKLELLICDNKNAEESLTEDSIETALRNENISIDKKDFSILEKMIKHNLPLTKENISYVKNLMEFQKNISQDENYEDTFINKYINSKGVEVDSKEGNFIKDTLKGFFSELNSLSEDDILTLVESGLDLTEDNIKSFNKIFKSSSSLYKTLNIAKKELDSGDLQVKNETSNPQSVDNNEHLKENSKQEQVSEEKNNVQVKNLEENISKKSISINTKKGFLELSDHIKNQVNDKLETMKSIIKDMIQVNKDIKPENIDKFMNIIRQDMNDFKVFNTLSDQYYYMDIPINVNKDEYECKLVIKDERKKGKKIDSKNVKIATSVKTVNMGVVDAFISINNKIMNIDLKANKKWMSILDGKKQGVLNALQSTGYNVYMSVSEREEEFNISTCSKFFEDNGTSAIDIKA